MAKLTDEEKITNRAYNEHAEAWAKKYQDEDFFVREYAKFHKILPKGRIIDVGSASGRDAKALIKLGYDYSGADISESLIKIARETVPNATFVHQSLYDLTFEDKFDGFWCTATLLHVPKSRIDEALSSIRSVLSKGAIGFITIKDGQGSEIEKYEIKEGAVLERFYQYWSRQEFETVLKRNGYEVLDYDYRPVSGRQLWHCFFVKLKR